MTQTTFTSDEVERYAQFVAGHPDADIDARHRAAVRAVLGGLATDGRLLPEGDTVTAQWTVRTTSELDGEKLRDPMPHSQALTWARYYRNISATRGTYPIMVELLRREVRSWPGGASYTGEWETVDEKRWR